MPAKRNWPRDLRDTVAATKAKAVKAAIATKVKAARAAATATKEKAAKAVSAIVRKARAAAIAKQAKGKGRADLSPRREVHLWLSL